MTKEELVKEISVRTGIGVSDVATIVNCVMEQIKDAVSKGDAVYLRGFGSFIRKKRAYKLFHAAPGKYIPIPEHYEPVLLVSPKFKCLVDNNHN